jgi:hypothetical protein
VSADWADLAQIQEFIEEPVLGHITFQSALPDHDAFVDLYGIQKKLRTWYFAKSIIWGPALIVGRQSDGWLKPATASIDLVRRYVLL